jgi:NADPH-dependent curcumin reductase CurA
MSLLVNRASMTGFLVGDYAARNEEATAALAGWLSDGSIKSREDIVKGLDAFPDAFSRLFTGANVGKLVLQLATE